MRKRRQTDRLTDRQTERQGGVGWKSEPERDRDTERDRDRDRQGQTDRDRQTDRGRERWAGKASRGERGRQTDRQTDTDTDTERHTQREIQRGTCPVVSRSPACTKDNLGAIIGCVSSPAHCPSALSNK